MTKPVSGKGSKSSGGKSEKKKGGVVKKTNDGGKLSKVLFLRYLVIPDGGGGLEHVLIFVRGELFHSY